MGDAEVDEVGEVVVGQQNVGRLDVAVHQPCLMRTVQCRRDLLDDVHRAAGVQRPCVQQGLQVHAVDEPHRHVQPAVDLADVVDRHDVGIVQTCRGAGLAAEPLVELGVLGVVRQQHLQRHHPVDLGVVSAPHLAHAAAAQQLDQLVAAKWRPLHRLTINPRAAVAVGERDDDDEFAMPSLTSRFGSWIRRHGLSCAESQFAGRLMWTNRLATLMLVDYYLRILHFDRRMPLNFDLGPLHVHLYTRAVFFMWVTVAILVIAGIAVLVSRKPELIQKWTTWVMIAPVVGIPIWIGRGTTAALAAVLAVVAVIEYARLVKLRTVDTCLLLSLAVLYPLAAWLHPSLLNLAPIVVLAVRAAIGVRRRRRERRAGVRRSPRSVRCGSAGRWRTW